MPRHRTPAEHRAFAKGQRREMTRAESLMWNALRAGRLDGFKFKRQVPFGRFVADFACAQAGLVVELVRELHGQPEGLIHDRNRDEWFRSQGIRVLRMPNDLVLASIELAVERIRQALPAPSPGSLRSPPSPSRGEGEIAS